MASPLPALNASLNAASAALLLCGWMLIRRRKVEAHRRCMLGAFGVSAAFLVSYLYYHYTAGSVRFQGQGTIRTVYFMILISHTVLAAAVPPLALRALYLAWAGRFAEHTWWAKRALPIWLYVSVNGVAVYWLLYRL
ncbi:MAG: DUF420 domain-containing protein [Elusimicrobia bacterium]|nr:DUF420 domain-containing protein [Elusimicrobiota bacterium]